MITDEATSYEALFVSKLKNYHDIINKSLFIKLLLIYFLFMERRLCQN